MYLSRLVLDPRNAMARRDLANPYDMHRTLVRAFALDEVQAPPRFLWRLESGSVRDAPTVLVQSTPAGNWSALEQVAGYLRRPAETKTFDLPAWVQPGASYRFRLVANPTVTREGKRLGLVGEEAQTAWLHRQALRHGFQLDAALVADSDVVCARKAAMPVSLQRACFEGLLTVLDASALSSALEAGIGPGKAFGFGLLSLARASMQNP